MTKNESGALDRRRGRIRGRWVLRVGLAALLPGIAVLTGCVGGIPVNGSTGSASSNGVFSISPGVLSLDTNCTGCNAGSSEMFSATLVSGGAAGVTWSLPSGGSYGSINASTGQYTPPSYLTQDSLQVTVTATLNSNTNVRASATLTVTPGFLQPLTPENFAVGAGGQVQVTGYIAEAGGATVIKFALASSATGSSGGLGTLGTPLCIRNNQTFAYCTVIYTAPATVTATSDTYIVATVGNSQSRESTVVLLNAEGLNSSPSVHQQLQNTPIPLGSSGGNNNDIDQNASGSIVDCCGGTLGSLIQDSGGKQYLLSNNHVLARSDQAAVGEMIVQPGLIEDSCVQYPTGALNPVGTLTSWVPLKTSTTNVDAAIAQVNSGAVRTDGAILELGKQRAADGTLAAAPPGTSSTGGRGETASIGLAVAKSGRTTGLTCASVSTVALSVQVSYYTDCAETKSYYTKVYTNQIGITGNQFSDAGDSGSLIVDTSNAEPVGLFFAGGQTSTGVSEGVANPVSDVLKELGSVANTSFRFVGATDHAVSCLNYGNATATAAQAITLSSAQQSNAEQALMEARTLVNPSAGIYGVAIGKSSDRVGEATVVVYVDPSANVKVPATVDAVRTTVIPASAQAVAMGVAPQSLLKAGAAPALTGQVLQQAIAVKQQLVKSLMKQNPAFFGVGVGQSFDNPREAALVVYVDRKQVPAQLPATIGGLRVRYVIMERLHVTRAYLSPVPVRSHCMPHMAPAQAQNLNLIGDHKLRELNFF